MKAGSPKKGAKDCKWETLECNKHGHELETYSISQVAINGEIAE
jgi:hypothetical protein